MITVLETTPVPGVRLLYRLAICLAIISGMFCLFFCGILLFTYSEFYYPHPSSPIDPNTPSYRQPAADSFNRLPNDYYAVLVLKKQLAQDKQDETIKSQIRELDQKLRIHFFKRRTIMLRTSHCLLIAAIIFFTAARTASVLKRKIPDPNETRPSEKIAGSWRSAAVTVWAMLFLGIALGLLFTPVLPLEQMIAAKLTADVPVPTAAEPNESAVLPVAPVDGVQKPIKLTEEMLTKNWVSFRNFNGNGIGYSGNPPIKWDGKKGENIVWQAEVPLPGKSSPVIWEDKLFITGADETKQQIYCYDIETGKILWTADVTKPAGMGKTEVSEDTGFAAPTAAVDGQHVFAMFANGELVAVDFTGKTVWRKSFGVPESSYGYASSPALFLDKLIVQFDVSDGSDGKSKILALDLNTGNVLWETNREIPNSWSSPMIKKIGDQFQVITCGDPFVIAYNPDDGKEIWRCKCLGGDVGPSPIAIGNVVLVTNQMPRTTAIDATGSGDISATHILWQGTNALPDTPSPLATENWFLTLDSGGYLTGYDPKTITNKKAKYWELEIGGGVSQFYSSPLLIGQLLYVFSKTEDDPKAFVIDLSKIVLAADGTLTEDSAKEMIISENPMPEPCVSSPAVLNDCLYIRGTKTIFCIKKS